MKSLGKVRMGYVVLVLLVFVLGQAAFAADTFVSDATGDDGNDGLSWATAKKTIQAGVTAAGSSGTVLVTNGTYTLTNEISIASAITVQGFNGKSNTFVNGNGATRCFNLAHAGAMVSGFIIMNGYMNGGTGGGGVYLSAGTISNCIVNSNCSYNSPGGGVRMTGGLVIDCAISSNSTPTWYGGGGLNASGGTARNCAIFGNSTSLNGNPSDCDDNGGGARISGAALLDNCIISNNVVTLAFGAGVYMSGGIVSNCTIVNNLAAQIYYSANGGAGGGVFCAGGLLVGGMIDTNRAARGSGVLCVGGTLQGALISRNREISPGASSSVLGAGVYIASGTISNCVINGNCSGYGPGGGVYMTGGLVYGGSICSNSAPGWYGGGGLWASGGTVQMCKIFANFTSGNGTGDDDNGGGARISGTALLKDCVISDNVATLANGGGVYMEGGTLLNCTVATNRAPGSQGGGIYFQGAGAVTNSIVYFNSAGAGANYTGAGGTWAYSCSTPKPDGTGNIDDDPLFVDLAGGDVHEKSRNGHWTAGGWVADSVQSPCIDAGTPYDAANAATYFSNEPYPNGSRINMGAYGNTAEASKTRIPQGTLISIR